MKEVNNIRLLEKFFRASFRVAAGWTVSRHFLSSEFLVEVENILKPVQ